MYRNQPHSRTLQTITVEPGCETGLYYILVANLAHRTTWKELKAFASQACEVDHAEVYPPTSGFVRVRGRANFERAFKFLDGNTLEYRALQADARNLNQATVVKLPPTDYHAARILRGEEGRIFPETGATTADLDASPVPYPHSAATVVGVAFTERQERASPTFNQVHQMDSPWGYVTPSSYVSDGGYQFTTASTVVPAPSPLVYQAAATRSYDVAPSAATMPHPAMQTAVYQPLTGPVPALAQSPTTPLGYDGSVAYYPPGTAYGMGTSYADYVRPVGSPSGHAYPADYSEAWPNTIHASQADQTRNHYLGQPPATTEPRKVVIRHLGRDYLSEAAVLNLLARRAGIDAGAGRRHVEKVHLPTTKNGKPRGTAYVTFSTADLAAAAVLALDGTDVAGARLEARLAEGGPPGTRPHGGSSISRSNGNNNSSGGRGGGNRSHQRLAAGAGRAGTLMMDGSRGSLSASSASPLSSTAAAAAAVSSAATGESGSQTMKRQKEEPPVIVDGSRGRWKKEAAPVVVDGSAGSKGPEGHRSGRC